MKLAHADQVAQRRLDVAKIGVVRAQARLRMTYARDGGHGMCSALPEPWHVVTRTRTRPRKDDDDRLQAEQHKPCFRMVLGSAIHRWLVRIVRNGGRLPRREQGNAARVKGPRRRARAAFEHDQRNK